MLAKLFGVDCHRGQQFSGERGNPDVVGLDGVHVEAKRVERLNLPAAMAQSKADARPDEVPIVCHRSSRQPWLITLELADMPDFIEAIRANSPELFEGPRVENRNVRAAAISYLTQVARDMPAATPGQMLRWLNATD